jgi:hypothetical protein
MAGINRREFYQVQIRIENVQGGQVSLHGGGVILFGILGNQLFQLVDLLKESLGRLDRGCYRRQVSVRIVHQRV